MKSQLKNKQLVVVLLIWVFINFIFLSISEADTHKEKLWPFTKRSLIDTYDLTEFMLYVLGPVVLIVSYTLLNTNENETKN